MWLLAYKKKNYLEVFFAKKKSNKIKYATMHIFDNHIVVYLPTMKYSIGKNKHIVECKNDIYNVYYLSDKSVNRYKEFLKKKKNLLWHLKHSFEKERIKPKLIFSSSSKEKLAYVLVYMYKKNYKLEFNDCIELEELIFKEMNMIGDNNNKKEE